MARLPLVVKLEWLEEAQRLIEHLGRGPLPSREDQAGHPRPSS
jgi:hypothetical protein